jgi:hypothetical protein
MIEEDQGFLVHHIAPLDVEYDNNSIEY